MTKKFSGNRQKESGAILIVSVILLVVLTLLAIAGLRSATLQERMAGNARDRAIAFQAAESALMGAEKLIGAGLPAANGTVTAAKACTKGVFRLDADGVPYFASKDLTFTGGAVKWDGGNPDFWNDWPWETANCYYQDNVTYVADADLGKAGKPIEKPRYVIEEIPKDNGNIQMYRVTAHGFGSSKNAVVILQATYKGS